MSDTTKRSTTIEVRTDREAEQYLIAELVRAHEAEEIEAILTIVIGKTGMGQIMSAHVHPDAVPAMLRELALAIEQNNLVASDTQH